MKLNIRSNTFTTGLAMFSMFFGAGNVIYPLSIGQYAQDQNFYAIIGFLITAVGVPFLGLVAMALFDGNYKEFFERIGKIPGFLVALFIMGLIGPFGAMPRLIAVSYSTFGAFFTEMPMAIYSAIAGLVIYFLTFKRSRFLDILGYVLTPVLLGSLFILIIKGLWSASTPAPAEDYKLSTFLFGLQEGYKTMDLLATFFFSSVVILCLKKELHPTDQEDYRKVVRMTLNASCIGASLLGICYLGFSYIASYHSQILSNVPTEKILGYLSLELMGQYGGIVTILAVTLACLTTAMALAAVFAEFLHEDITRMKVSYPICLIFTLICTYLMSILEFSGIMGFLAPILSLCYPALIVLSIANILYKLYGFKPVKVPFFAAILATLLFNFLTS